MKLHKQIIMYIMLLCQIFRFNYQDQMMIKIIKLKYSLRIVRIMIYLVLNLHNI